MAWEAIRDADFVTSSDRKLIDDYLHKLMGFLALHIEREAGNSFELPYDCPDNCGWAGQEIFNHAWTRDLGVMVYAVMTQNNTLFQRGIRRYFAILDGLIRPDGSHFRESQRGGSGVTYSIGATDTLIRMAELAAIQGYDLYSVEIDGISLQLIIDFHLSVLKDETLIHPYAQSVEQNPGFCEDDDCRNNWDSQFFSDEHPSGYDLDGGWIGFDVFRQRFPNSALVDRYLDMFPDERFTSWVYSQAPFMQACEFRDLTKVSE